MSNFPDHKYLKMVNGRLELTPEGVKWLQDELISSALSVPGPIVGRVSPPSMRQQIEAQMTAYGFSYDQFKQFWASANPYAGSMTGRMNVTRPPYTQTLKNPGGAVSKIPVSGMSGFSEKGQPQDWDLAIGEVYGYRWWKIQVPARFAGYLAAPEKTVSPSVVRLIGANNQPWGAGVQEARCTSGRTGMAPTWGDLLDGRSQPFKHEPPEIREACGCGFWAYFDQFLPVTTHFGDLGSGKPYRTYQDMVEIPVFGVIKGSGRTIIGEKGFRCQFAEIVGLALPEIAQTQLSWWTKDWQIAETTRNARRTTMYQALMGGPGWYEDGGRESTPQETTPASRDEVVGRVAFVEGLLSTVYPDAKIMCDDTALRAYYPPDKNYS